MKTIKSVHKLFSKYFSYLYAIALALLTIITGQKVEAAATAYTTPVGYLTVAVPANSDTTIAPSLSQAPLLRTASTGIAGDVITVAATGAATDAFINALPDTNSKTYVLVITGPLAGLRYPVTANTATTVTVNGGATTLATQGFVSGNQIAVVPYWTLDTLFPAGAGVGQSNDIFNASSFVMFSDQVGVGYNRAASAFYFYNDGTDGNPVGWYNNDNVFDGLKGTVAIDPAVMLTIRSSITAPASSVTVSGTVPDAPLATTVLTATGLNDEYLASPYPIDITLAQSGLQSVVAASTDIFSPTDLVFVYPDDLAGVINKGTSATYFYFAGDVDNVAGWYDNDNVFNGVVTAPVLKAGRSFMIRKVGGTPGKAEWSAPLPYSVTL